MDVRDHLRDALRNALADAGVDPLPDEIALERPANREHGDWSSNVALATANETFNVQGPQKRLARGIKPEEGR